MALVSLTDYTFQQDDMSDALFPSPANRAGQDVWGESLEGWEIWSPWQRHDGSCVLPATGSYERYYDTIQYDTVQYNITLLILKNEIQLSAFDKQ